MKELLNLEYGFRPHKFGVDKTSSNLKHDISMYKTNTKKLKSRELLDYERNCCKFANKSLLTTLKIGNCNVIRISTAKNTKINLSSNETSMKKNQEVEACQNPSIGVNVWSFLCFLKVWRIHAECDEHFVGLKKKTIVSPGCDCQQYV